MSEWRNGQFNIDFDKDRANFVYNGPNGEMFTMVNIPFSSSDEQTQAQAKAAAIEALKQSIQSLLNEI